jgi:glucose-6-phosphate 1-dehydrogenase
MIQSHLLQVLCFVAMEPPTGLNERDLRDRKLDVLRAVHRLTPDEVARKTVRARYTSGEIDGHAVPSYADEEGVEPDRGTETFAEVELSIENERWADVPFVLRSGKALERDRSEIAVYFRPPLQSPFDADIPPEANVLRMCFDPGSVSLTLSMNAAGDASALQLRDLTGGLPGPDLPPYAHLLRAILHGDTALSVRDDEAEESWRVVEPILEAWRAGRSPLREYQAGRATLD